MELVSAEEGRAEQETCLEKVGDLQPLCKYHESHLPPSVSNNQKDKVNDSDIEKKDGEGSEHNGQEPPSTLKKRHRVVWKTELHTKFLTAVEQLGTDAVPKKIRELMNVEGLTREDVASHLQKYRVCLRKVSFSNRNRSSGYPVSTNYNSMATRDSH